MKFPLRVLGLILLAAYAPAVCAQSPGERLLDAASREDLKDVQAALGQCRLANARDQSGRTALLIALEGSASEYRIVGAKDPIVRFLIQRGAGINVQDNQGWSPLQERSAKE